MQNPTNDSHYLAITTHNGKSTIKPSMPVVHEYRDDVVDVNEACEAKYEK